MKNFKVKILIGSLAKGDYGPITTITNAFIDGLNNKYDMIPHYANRKFGVTSQAGFNVINVYYFFKHLLLWTGRLSYYRPDIVHYPLTSYWNLEKSIIFLKIAKLFRTHTVAHLHGGSFDKFWKTLSPLRKKLAKRELKQLDALIVLSENWKIWVCENIDLEEDKVIIVNNPIDSEFENNALSFNTLEGSNIFFIGALGKRKGVYDILKVASQLKKMKINCSILLAGPEERKGDLKKINKIVNRQSLDNVEVLKPIYNTEKIDYFKRNSIFLFPSYNENFPLVIIEAAAAGKAIITTKVGALPEFFNHNESVIFVEPGNIEQIIGAIIELLDNQKMRLLLGNGARKVFLNKLSRDKIIDSLDKVYQKIMNDRIQKTIHKIN